MTTVKRALVRKRLFAVVAAALLGASTMGSSALARGGGGHGGGHGFGGGGHAIGHGRVGGHSFAMAHGRYDHDSRRVVRSFRGYGGLYGYAGDNGYCNPYYYPYNCY
jgi:hypothetical protein